MNLREFFKYFLIFLLILIVLIEKDGTWRVFVILLIIVLLAIYLFKTFDMYDAILYLGIGIIILGILSNQSVYGQIWLFTVGGVLTFIGIFKKFVSPNL